jgi:hypothetical protein
LWRALNCTEWPRPPACLYSLLLSCNTCLMRSLCRWLQRRLHTGAVDITPQIAHELIIELRKEGVEVIVAPYEADAQV